MDTVRSLFYVIRRFPNHKQSIYRLFKRNEDFKSLCEDHRLCYETVERWKQSESEKAPALRKEYENLLQELEQEITQILNDLQKVKSP